MLGAVAMVLVQDMDRALRFYRDMLGLRVAFETEESALFEEQIGLMRSGEALPEDNMQFNSVMITLFVDDVEAAFAELTQRGVAFLVPPTRQAGTVLASCRDTEGNLVQLMQQANAGTQL